MISMILVAPYGLTSTTRFIEAAATLDGVNVGLISHEPAGILAERMSSDTRARIRGFAQIDNSFDPDGLEAAVRQVSADLGGRVDALAAVLEPLQESVAVVRERLGIRGMDVAEARRFRDKSLMKDTLRQAGIPCARHFLATSVDEALAFADTNLPLVVKPPAGAGAVDTFRVDERSQLEGWLASISPGAPSPQRPVLLEEFVQGEEFSFDSVTIDGREVFHSISSYSPTPLEVMSTPWIQWTVLFPRHIDGPEFAPIREAGPEALKALGMVTGMSHMEWFRRPDGTIAISEVGARPPGAQITSLLSYAHGHDFYRAWAALNAFGTFEPPPRSYAAGAAYLRGQGTGKVANIEGVEKIHRELGDLVVEARLPSIGQQKSSSYEGEGYVILRDPDTEVVADGLRRIVSEIRVHLDQQEG
ncbi:MAG: ATP-grasp domain-containing protein [Acidimicrobiia bacterium]|nr:ATP-grasp domain-containing protein [Acidimicrobiia bacterium]